MISATGCDRPRWAGGFTLVELTIVLFILATLVAVALPSFLRSFKTAEINAAARDVVTLSQLARLQAAIHQTEAQLHVDLDRQVLSVTQQLALTGEDETTNTTAVTHKTVALSSASRLVAAERTGEPAQRDGEVIVVYYPNGTCDGGTLWLQGAEKQDGVTIVLDPVTAKALPYEVSQ